MSSYECGLVTLQLSTKVHAPTKFSIILRRALACLVALPIRTYNSSLSILSPTITSVGILQGYFKTVSYSTGKKFGKSGPKCSRPILNVATLILDEFCNACRIRQGRICFSVILRKYALPLYTECVARHRSEKCRCIQTVDYSLHLALGGRGKKI